MKLKAMIFLLAFFGHNLSQAALNADLRVDNDSHNYNEDAKLAGGFSNYSHFRIVVGRLDYQGKLNEDVNYRVRLRFNSDQGVVSKRDQVNSTLDFAYVTHKISESFSLTVGKMATLLGGIEGNTTSADVYLPSEAYGGTAILGGTSSVSLQGTNKLHYSTGAQAAFNFADGSQQLMLQVFNEEGVAGLGYGTAGDSVDASGKLNQTGSLAGLVYRGAFLEKSLNLIASYHAETMGSKDNKVGLAALGLESKTAGFVTQLDFLKNDYQRVGGTSPKQSLSSYVLNLKYAIENWTPMIKLAYSEEKLDRTSAAAITTDVTNKYSSAGLVLEYKPKIEDNFRYHIAVYDRTMKPEIGNDRKETQALIGMRLQADFLKN